MEDFEATKARRNGGRTFHEPYSELRMENMKRLIAKFDERGRKKRYAVFVDGEMVVPTTHDVDEFDEYQDFVEPTTEHVEVRTFFGDSPNCNRYMFYFNQVPMINQGGLGQVPGQIDPHTMVQQALEKQQLETRIMLLEDELKRKRKKLRNYKEIQSQLDEKQLDLNGLLTKGIELYGAMKGGAPGALPMPVQGLPTPSEVEIERELSPADKLYEDLKSKYSELHLMRAVRIWELMIKHPELQEEITAIITAKKQQNG